MSKIQREIDRNIKTLSKLSSTELNHYARNVADNDTLSRILKVADIAYHTLGEPLFDDRKYDLLKDILSEIDPGNTYLTTIGAPVNGNSQIIKLETTTLPICLPSINKVLTEKKLNRWLEKNPANKNYIVSNKLDGLSALWFGNKFYTRGQGSEGTDITHIAGVLKLPQVSGYGVRGELIIPKANRKYFESGKHLRNIAVGAVMRQKNIDISILKH